MCIRDRAEGIRLNSIGEELRVLYVALTRAVEKLILVGGIADSQYDCMEKTAAGEHSWTGVSISEPGRAKEAGCRCLSYNFACLLYTSRCV